MNCARYNIQVQDGAKCVLVVLVVSGSNGDDLDMFEEIIKTSIDSGTFDSMVASNGLPAVVIPLLETVSPSGIPTNYPVMNPTINPTDKPAIKVTNNPTRTATSAPTKAVDPCPDLTEDCEGCVMNTNCL